MIYPPSVHCIFKEAQHVPWFNHPMKAHQCGRVSASLNPTPINAKTEGCVKHCQEKAEESPSEVPSTTEACREANLMSTHEAQTNAWFSRPTNIPETTGSFSGCSSLPGCYRLIGSASKTLLMCAAGVG